MRQTNGKKISQFLEEGTITSDGYLTFIQDGVNYKILYTDFLAELGVTGTIEPIGGVPSTPVLDVDGSVNYIRNLEDGSGITMEVSLDGGITVAHNFTADATGVPLLVDTSAASPVIRSLVAGQGIQLDGSDGEVTITATGIVTPSTVIVASLSDLPEPVGSVITLLADTQYQLAASINLGANRLVLSDGTSIVGAGPFVTVLTYSGSSALFTWTNAQIYLSNFSVSAPNASLFAGTNPVTPGAVEVYSLYIEEIDSLGSIDDALITVLNNIQAGNIVTTGLELLGVSQYLSVSNCLVVMQTGTFIDLGTAVFGGVRISSNVIQTPGSVVLVDGAASSANISAGGSGVIVSNRLIGTVTINGISVDDTRWWFFLNDQLQDSRTDGLLSMQGNATASVIAATGTPVIVAGTWVVSGVSGMSGTTNGRLTYNEEKPVSLPITASVTAIPVSGSNQAISIYIALNGSVITASRMQATITSTAAQNITATWQLTFEEGDYIEVFVQNETATNNVTITRAVLRVN